MIIDNKIITQKPSIYYNSDGWTTDNNNKLANNILKGRQYKKPLTVVTQ